MRDVSNKTVLTLLVIALVVTVAGTFVSVSKLGSLGDHYASLTGSAVDTGTATITIQGAAAIQVVDNAIDFGTGYVNSSCSNGEASIASDGETPVCWINISGTSDPVDDFHTVENNGTTNLKVNVTLITHSHAQDFLCEGGTCGGSGTVAEVQVKSEDGGSGEAGACNSGLLTSYTLIADNSAIYDIVLCSDMDANDGADLLEVNVNLSLPQNMPQGAKTATIQYTGLASS